MAEIVDEESARAWLETQPHQVQVWFVARCALRALPGLGSTLDEAFDDLAIVSFRGTLITAVAAMKTTEEISRSVLIQAASSAVRFKVPTFSGAIDAGAYHSVQSAAGSAFSVADNPIEAATRTLELSVSAIHSASGASPNAYSAAYSAASVDSKVPTIWSELWLGQSLPNGFDHL